MGKVFWSGALGRESGGRRDPACPRAQGVRAEAEAHAVEGETELAFAHALVRDVAYGQIARPDSAETSPAADWIESLGRPEDHAELIAYHWRSALELARAAGGDETSSSSGRVSPSERGRPCACAQQLCRRGRAFRRSPCALAARRRASGPPVPQGTRAVRATDDRREQALEEAREALLAVGDTELAAETEAFLALVSWYRGHGEATRAHLSRAEELCR